MRSRALAVLAAALLAGCSTGDVPPTDGDRPEIYADASTGVLTREQAERCRAAGGEVRRGGLAGFEQCVYAFADAGTACTDGSQCEGQCRAVGDTAFGEPVAGVCQADSSPFGCYAEVEDGLATAALCVD